MTEYGPEIPVNGKRPEFVRDDDMVQVQWRYATWGEYPASCIQGWVSSITTIRLPATHPYYATQINYDLPVQTRDGRDVRILCTDAPGDYPVVGIVDEDVRLWRIDGSYSSESGPLHLQNAPAKPVRTVQWLYANAGTSYDTTQRGANLELIFEDGKLVEAVVHG